MEMNDLFNMACAQHGKLCGKLVRSGGEWQDSCCCVDGHDETAITRARRIIELQEDLERASFRFPPPVRDRALPQVGEGAFSLNAAHIERQRDWSAKTFGPGFRRGTIDHIRKELEEIEADPLDLTEWVDVIILALDGAWRAGHAPQQILDAIQQKQTKNEGRTWPDWRTQPLDQAIEHDRTGES